MDGSEKPVRPRQVSLSGNRGVTLIELMIVVAIVALLAGIVYPAYQEHVNRAKRAEGHAALVEFANRMEKFAYDNGNYSSATVAGVMGSTTTENGYYLLQFASGEPTATTYELQAVPQMPFSDSGCQTLTLDQSGDRNVSGGATKTKNQCW